MAQCDKACITLSFNKKINKSHRNKVKEFWAFLDSEDRLKPYTVKSKKEPPHTRDTDEAVPELAKKLWFNQLQVFQKYGLDKAALAATKTCKLCHTGTRPSEFADTVKEPYEQLANDMKVYDERVDNETEIATEQDKKKSSIS